MNGVVLAGGKSRRMGQDKGAIIYHQKPQREHTADLLDRFCQKVYLAVRPDQLIQSTYPLLVESSSEGPLSGILQAFQKAPQSTWLVLACDLPYLEANTIDFLIKNRKKQAVATAFLHPNTQQLEPLLSIWEATTYPLLLSFYQEGGRSPKRFLEQYQAHTILPPNIMQLRNVNTPDEEQSFLGANKLNIEE